MCIRDRSAKVNNIEEAVLYLGLRQIRELSMATPVIEDMEKIAESFGVKFRLDAALFPCTNGDRHPLDLRVQPREVVAKEFSNKERFKAWRDYYDDVRGVALPDKLYQCGAGVTGFHVDAYGGLKPCLMAKGIGYDLSKGSFRQGWPIITSDVGNKRPGKSFQCNTCCKVHLCSYCPAFFAMETGAEDVKSEYLCAIGEQRFMAIESMRSVGVSREAE